MNKPISNCIFRYNIWKFAGVPKIIPLNFQIIYKLANGLNRTTVYGVDGAHGACLLILLNIWESYLF